MVKQPVAQGLAHVDQRAEEVRVEHLAPKRAVDALGVGVLGGLARLNPVHDDGLRFAPSGEANAGEFGAVAGAQLRRAAVAFDSRASTCTTRAAGREKSILAPSGCRL